MTDFRVVIPARYAAARLPGKPLLDIAGKPMVVRVAECAQASGATEILVATDHPEVERVVTAHGVRVVMTRADHASGTDRIAEVAQLSGWHPEDIVVNVQGDEPLIDPAVIMRVARNLAASPKAEIATVSHPVVDRDMLFNPHVVKVVTDREGYALYFSRAPIPWARDAFSSSGELPAGLPVQRHVGIYAYRTRFLQAYTKLAPASIEQFEALEQLRALWHGFRVSVLEIHDAFSAGVDTPEDLQRVRQIFAERLRLSET